MVSIAVQLVHRPDDIFELFRPVICVVLQCFIPKEGDGRTRWRGVLINPSIDAEGCPCEIDSGRGKPVRFLHGQFRAVSGQLEKVQRERFQRPARFRQTKVRR